MLLESVEVRSFRTIRSLTIALTRGLNVIHGDNDVGKSTLMDAIRACLTLRARGTGARYASLRPRTGGDPEVRVSFWKEGTLYTVSKRFGAKGTAHLNVRPDKGIASDYSGDDAEHQLRVVLGVADDPSRRAPDLGVLPLLWVEQGTSRDLPTLEGQGAAALAERLRGLSGEVIAGERGEAIFATVECSFNETFTSRGPRAGSPLQLATDAAAQANQERDKLQARQRELETTAATFDDLGVRLRSVQGSLPSLDAAVRAAEAEMTAVRDGQAALAKAVSAVNVALVSANVAKERHERRVTHRAEIASARVRAESCRAAVSTARSALVEHDAAREAVETRVAAADAAEGRVRGEVADAQRLVARIEAARELAELDTRIMSCRAHADEHVEAMREAGAEPIDEAVLREIERLGRAADLAAAALETSATTLMVRASDRTAVVVDGTSIELEPGNTVTQILTTSTTISYAGVELEVSPGGSDLQGLRARAAASEGAFKRALSDVAAADLGEARARAAARAAALQRADVAARLLQATAPQGLADLEAKRRQLLVPDLMSDEDVSDAALAAARGSVTSGVADLDRAAREASDARAHLTLSDATRDRLHGDGRVASEALANAVDGLERLDAELSSSIAAYGTDDELAAAHAGGLADLKSLQEQRDQVCARLPKVSFEDAEERVRRAQRALDTAKEEERHLSGARYRLEVDLQAPDLIGLDDRLAEAAARLENAEIELARLTADGEALRLLYELLRDERAAARRRFLAPLAGEIQPLLGLLYPGSRVELDDNYAITRIERAADGAHDFGTLGGGSQEQLAILVRLAMARVLGAGGPVPVMLDDAIVFTSETRFARMANVLLAAAKDLQVLVFTCHWPRYRELGPDNVIDLEAAKSSAATASSRAA
jgi:DNA repair exonuclease SbcCD ATPase subunit